MQRRLLLLSFSLLASLLMYPGYTTVQAQPYPPSYQPPPPPPPRYGGNPATSTENCGTPDEPKPCPPMPRVPLQNYPGYRQ